MTYKDILTKRTYTSNGQEKTIWLNVGTLRTTDDGKDYIELNMFPNTSFYVFEKKPKEEAPERQLASNVKPVGYAEEAGMGLKGHALATDEERANEENINLEDIPF